MRKLLSTLAMAALVASIGASAQAMDGWYGRADLGYSVDGEIEGDFFDGEETFSADADLDNDWMADVGVGFGYANGFRSEAELAHRTNEVSGAGADVEASSLMINGFYDFNRDGAIQPYLGLGLGYAQVDSGADDDSNWAWQGLAGVAIPLGERLSLDIGYRYFNVQDLESGPISDLDYTHQAATLGLRFQFGAPAPAAVAQPEPAPAPAPAPLPAPAACPTSEFVVYFEWDRSNLNEAAIATIDQAVARARQCNVTATIIVGHTDTSGSNAYNAGLSERRAGVVRDAMVARGMSASTMTVQARGETDLARQTRDGVREPLNRRTAVTISFR